MIVDQVLIDRILASETSNLEARLGPYALRPGNPSGIYVRRFGSRATAFIAERISARFFNSVLDAGAELLPELDAIIAHYRAHQASCALEIAPGRLSEEFGAELGRRGFFMAEFHTAMACAIGPRDAERATVPGVEIEDIDRGDLERFLDVYLEGWGVAPDGIEPSKENMRLWSTNSGWRFYLAKSGGLPAGAAILDVTGRTGFLGSASTLPAARGKSVQRALIERRIADAARMGCDLIAGGAYFGTPSMRNQQRAGMATAFTRGIWVEARAFT